MYNHLGFNGIMFENKYRYTLNQVAKFYEVDTRTIKRLLEEHSEELKKSGYELFIGTKLKTFKDLINQQRDIDVPLLIQDDDNEAVGFRAPSLSVFTFKTFLNVGMLLQSSEKTRAIRTLILNTIHDIQNPTLGRESRNNQRDEEFVPSAIRAINYRSVFTQAIDLYVVPSKFKYAQLTDKIYSSIFKENAKEYRKVLDLSAKDNVRATMYAEVLDLIASYENGFADYLRIQFENTNRKFTLPEVYIQFANFENITNKIYEPIREKARGLMASRNMALRDAWHEKLKDYVGAVSIEYFEKFLGEKSRSLEERLKENPDIFKRLSDR